MSPRAYDEDREDLVGPWPGHHYPENTIGEDPGREARDAYYGDPGIPAEDVVHGDDLDDDDGLEDERGRWLDHAMFALSMVKYFRLQGDRQMAAGYLSVAATYRRAMARTPKETS